jgi:hypothetical protein
MLNSPVWRGRSRAAFCGGLFLGAISTAFALLLVGSLVRLAAPPSVWRWGLAGVVALLAMRELGLLRFPLPQNRRLVPEFVDRHGPVLGPLQFGFEIGTSMRTYTPSALPHATALAVLLLAGPVAAVSAAAGFGLGRSLMTVSNLAYSDDNSWDDAWITREPWIRRLLVAAFLVATAVILSG